MATLIKKKKVTTVSKSEMVAIRVFTDVLTFIYGESSAELPAVTILPRKVNDEAESFKKLGMWIEANIPAGNILLGTLRVKCSLCKKKSWVLEPDSHIIVDFFLSSDKPYLIFLKEKEDRTLELVEKSGESVFDGQMNLAEIRKKIL